MRPTGRVSASSPRRALLSRPAVSRALIVWSSSSEIWPFKPEEQAAVDRGRVVDPVPVADQAAAVPAEVEDLIPVGAIS